MMIRTMVALGVTGVAVGAGMMLAADARESRPAGAGTQKGEALGAAIGIGAWAAGVTIASTAAPKLGPLGAVVAAGLGAAALGSQLGKLTGR